MNSESLYKRIGAFIRTRRDHLEMNQEDLARVVRLSRASIANIEKADKAFSFIISTRLPKHCSCNQAIYCRRQSGTFQAKRCPCRTTLTPKKRRT